MTTADPSQPAESPVQIWVEGRAVCASAGRSVAAALLTAGYRDIVGAGTVFCGMGSCYGCVATIDGRPGTRTCLTAVADGMRITARRGARS